MIQRKDSLSFMEFIRGKYDTTNLAYIMKLLSGMTNSERTMIQSVPFETLWNHVWYQPSTRLSQEFDAARNKFVAIAAVLPSLIAASVPPRLRDEPSRSASPHEEHSRSTSPHESLRDEPEWGFPKGRRRLKENDLVCAIREFGEETGFTEQDVVIHAATAPFEEVFYGTNNILYRHIYYLAQMVNPNSSNPQINPANINQAREVRAISWFNIQETVSHIREHNQERKDLIDQVHKYITTNIPYRSTLTPTAPPFIPSRSSHSPSSSSSPSPSPPRD